MIHEPSPASTIASATAVTAATADPAAGRHSLLANTLASLVTQLVTWCFTLAATVYVPRVLGAAAIGMLNVAGAWWVLGSLIISAGSEPYVVKRVARVPEDLHAIVRVALAVRVVVGATLLTGALIVGYVLKLEPEARTVLLFTGIFTCIWSCISLLQAAVQGYERLSYMAPGNIVEKVFSAVGSITIVRLGYHAAGVAGVGILAATANLAVLVWIVRRNIAPSATRTSIRWRALLRGGLPFFWSMAASTLYLQVITIFLGVLTNNAVTGYYSVASRLFGASLFIPTALLAALFPVLSRQHASDAQSLRRTAQRAFNILVLLGLPLSVGLSELAGPFVHLIYGHRFEGTVPIMSVFGAILLATYLNMYVSQLLNAIDRQKAWMVISVLSLVLIVPLSAVCILYFQAHAHNGGIGAAIAFLVTESLQTALGLALVARRILSRHTVSFALRCALCATLMGMTLLILSGWPLAARIVMAGALYLGASMLLRTLGVTDLRGIVNRQQR